MTARAHGIAHRPDKAGYGTCLCKDCAITKRMHEISVALARAQAMKEAAGIARDFRSNNYFLSWQTQIAAAIERAAEAQNAPDPQTLRRK